MKFTKTLLYALVCLKHLAESFGRYVEVREIASAHQIPEAYCQRVLFALAREGIVLSRKGKGFISNTPLDRLSLQRLAGILNSNGCHKEMEENGYGLLMERLEKQMNNISVSQLLV